MTVSTRRIFKSAITSQNLIRELLQSMFLGEIVAPGGERAWLVSPWISDVVIFDNRAGSFNAINPDWAGRQVRLVEVTVDLMARGTPVGVATSLDSHNKAFLETLRERARSAGLSEALEVVEEEHLHTKGILLKKGLLLGSMNLTYRGLELNDETIVYDTTPEAVAEARLSFEAYLRVAG